MPLRLVGLYFSSCHLAGIVWKFLTDIHEGVKEIDDKKIPLFKDLFVSLYLLFD